VRFHLPGGSGEYLKRQIWRAFEIRADNREYGTKASDVNRREQLEGGMSETSPKQHPDSGKDASPAASIAVKVAKWWNEKTIGTGPTIGPRIWRRS
jgi:hypothetical protein